MREALQLEEQVLAAKLKHVRCLLVLYDAPYNGELPEAQASVEEVPVPQERPLVTVKEDSAPDVGVAEEKPKRKYKTRASAWTEAEDAIIKTLFKQGEHDDAIALRLPQRNVDAVKARRLFLRLKRARGGWKWKELKEQAKPPAVTTTVQMRDGVEVEVCPPGPACGAYDDIKTMKPRG